jgi:hypothetical protein
MDANRFDRSIFNEVRPTYVGPPVQEIADAREHLTLTAKENETTANMLDEAFAMHTSELQGDPVGINLVLGYKDSFKADLDKLLAEKNYAYAGNLIQNHTNKYVGDPRIVGRRKSVAKLNGQLDAIRNNPNISTSVKQAWSNNADLSQFIESDENGMVWNTKDIPLPYEQKDVNKAFLEAASIKFKVPDMTGIESITFYDAQGNPTKDYSKAVGNADVVAFTKNGTVTTSVNAGDLNDLFESMVRNDEGMLGYLVQNALINDYNVNGTNPIARMGEVFNNPELRENVIKNASTKMANSLSFFNKVVTEDFDTKSLFSKSAGRTDDRDPNMEEIRHPIAATNTFTTLKTKDELNKAKQSYETTAESLYNTKPDGTELTKDEKLMLSDAALNGTVEDMRMIANQYGQHPDDFVANAYRLRDAKAKSEIAQAKEVNITRQLNASGKFSDMFEDPTKFDPTGKSQKEINKNLEVTNALYELQRAGYDWTKMEGSTPYEKIHNATTALLQERGVDRLIQGGPGNPASQVTKVLPNGELKESFGTLRTHYGNNRISQYNKEFNSKLAEPNNAATNIGSSTIPLWKYNAATDTKNENAIGKILGTKAGVSGFYLADSNGDQLNINNRKYNSLQAAIENLEDIDLFLTDKPLNGSNKSFRAIYRGKRGEDYAEQEVYIPLGVEYGGISTDMYESLIKGNPKYRAEALINDFMVANIQGEHTYSDYPDVTFRRNGDTVEYIIKERNKEGEVTNMRVTSDKINAINYISGNMVNDESLIEFKNYIRKQIDNNYMNEAPEIEVLKRNFDPSSEPTPEEIEGIREDIYDILNTNDNFKAKDPAIQSTEVEGMLLYIINSNI